MKPLAINDPITVLDETGKLLMHCRLGAKCASFDDCHHTGRFSMAGAVAGPMIALADEGVTWCRGHMSDKDDEGKALLVAAALAPSGPRGAVGPGPCPIGPQGPVGVAGTR